jgi:ATP-dependent DNA helicase RecG
VTDTYDPKKKFEENPLDTRVQFLKGVGPRLGAIFNGRGIGTIKDLLYFFPRKYEDRSKITPVKELTEGTTASLELVVQTSSLRPLRGRFSKIFEVKAKDAAGEAISLKWFRIFKGFEKKFEPGTKIIVTGSVKVFGSIREMVHPEVQFDLADDLHVGRIVPVYVEIDGVPTKTLRKVIDAALTLASSYLKDTLPVSLLKRHGFPPLSRAISEVHFPSENHSSDSASQKFTNFRSPAHERLIYEEFFKFEYHVLSRKLNHEKELGHGLTLERLKESLAAWKQKLSFELTRDQAISIDEIFADLAKPHPMNRLLQGDVGAGKTAVALLSALASMDQGYQVAIMAPTEILAEQHYQNTLRIFGAHLPVKLLVGKTSAPDRRLIQSLLDSDSPALIIGTHALIEDPVKFKRLGLVVIDEQHRFGVEQRRKLREKSKIQPHMLVMTATPIPRTLALTAYGDLSVSFLRERPPGRTPIKTFLVRQAEHARMIEKVKSELREGRQAYFIFPLVNDSEEEGFTHLKSAVTAAENLAKVTFPEFRVGLLHGKLSSLEKATIMDQFRKNEVQILVATTVVEVGVDVPNASVMVIEHPERFGLSQLHQLRGRIGRGEHPSICFLRIDRPPSLPTPERLEVMCETEDGFKIAEADLELRGPGEFLGTRQSGALPFKIASLVRDQDWLIKARNDVIEILAKDPELNDPENFPFKKYLQGSGKTEASQLKTS